MQERIKSPREKYTILSSSDRHRYTKRNSRPLHPLPPPPRLSPKAVVLKVWPRAHPGPCWKCTSSGPALWGWRPATCSFTSPPGVLRKFDFETHCPEHPQLSTGHCLQCCPAAALNTNTVPRPTPPWSQDAAPEAQSLVLPASPSQEAVPRPRASCLSAHVPPSHRCGRQRPCPAPPMPGHTTVLTKRQR